MSIIINIPTISSISIGTNLESHSLTCLCKDKTLIELHNKLYGFNIKHNICNIKTYNSVKIVLYQCNKCKTDTNDKICSIINRDGICKGCVKDKTINNDNIISNKIIDIIQNQDILLSQDELRQIVFNNISCSLKNGVIREKDMKDMKDIKGNIEKIEENGVKKDKKDKKDNNENVINDTQYNKIRLSISNEETIKRPCNIVAFMDTMEYIICYNCNIKIPNIYTNTNRIWKENELCDWCWMAYEDERDKLWNYINNKSGNYCNICNIKKKGKGHRFNYDHINAFDKTDTISNMISVGRDINSIEYELDKCQLLCLPCHQIITTIENRYPFITIKKQLYKSLKGESISQQEYDIQIKKWYIIYDDIMSKIYTKLRSILYICVK